MGRRETAAPNFFMSYIKLLEKILVILKNKKAGKNTIRDFEEFIKDYKETKNLFHLTFPDKSDTFNSH